ncbi:ATP-grasp fold amidoligase family protein [uncultured Pseudokineococcus sp.]|uniref:ATP-grasp fold amidoligase family protein n=1 Tax=uncultured Pseudokineococcus sp. TaxID=1642928 RepID=UPI0026207DFD|nr:ATP-grasp fold amidoligase family protein [uncultured Pseudokineococcus sp.]
MRDPVFDVNDKKDSQRWAQQLGLRTAEVLAAGRTASTVPWCDLPERFVVKPDKGVASKGVFLLERTAEGFRDLRRGTATTAEEVTEELLGLAAAGTVSEEVLVESMVRDPQTPGWAPIDWKVLAFYGRVGLITAIRTPPGAPRACRWFDASWQDLGLAVHGPTKRDASIPTPRHAEAMLRAASLVSACVPTPFLRVDLYEDEAGPVFGEITPQPGGPLAFRRGVDRWLGEMHVEAQGRLMARAASSGALAPSLAPLPWSVVL